MNPFDVRLYRAQDYPRMPWRNGAGTTQEVACNAGGSSAAFDWRLSIADIGESGGFSSFAGYQRVITVINALQAFDLVFLMIAAENPALPLPLSPTFKHPAGRVPVTTMMGVTAGANRILPPVSLLRRMGGGLPQAGKSASAYPPVLTVPRVCCQEIAQYPEGFQQLKSVVVAQFERTYLTHALARSKGNIALAARNSHKHRRAFWALMRKHQISADPFRDNGF